MSTAKKTLAPADAPAEVGPLDIDPDGPLIDHAAARAEADAADALRQTALAQAALLDAGRALQAACHNAAAKSGWWTDLKTGVDLRVQPGQPLQFNVPEKLMLIVSEVSEGMEGHRKNLQDDKLPHRSMLEVELADAVIRVFDLAGGLGLDVGAAIVEKLAYNASREDHKLSARMAAGGKAF